MRRFMIVLSAFALVFGFAASAQAAGDACSIVGKFIGSAAVSLTGQPPATSHVDITFAATDPCEQGTFVANSRVQLLGSQDSFDEQILGVYAVTDGFMFLPMANGATVLGEPTQCQGGVCNLIPFTAAREGSPDIRFSGVLGRAAVVSE